MKKFYKFVNRTARRLGLSRLEWWAYRKWMLAWVREDPAAGFWRFADEFFAEWRRSETVRPVSS